MLGRSNVRLSTLNKQSNKQPKTINVTSEETRRTISNKEQKYFDYLYRENFIEFALNEVCQTETEKEIVNQLLTRDIPAINIENVKEGLDKIIQQKF